MAGLGWWEEGVSRSESWRDGEREALRRQGRAGKASVWTIRQFEGLAVYGTRRDKVREL